jgi:hypothetical protein
MRKSFGATCTTRFSHSLFQKADGFVPRHDVELADCFLNFCVLKRMITFMNNRK